MFDPISWPELVNHDRTPIRPLSETTLAKLAEAVRSALALEAIARFENAEVLFESPPCAHYSKASKDDRA